MRQDVADAEGEQLGAVDGVCVAQLELPVEGTSEKAERGGGDGPSLIWRRLESVDADEL
ncbi:MAG: hypothetical protein ACI4WT_12580 [Oligosphaeraceae bacterium]